MAQSKPVAPVIFRALAGPVRIRASLLHRPRPHCLVSCAHRVRDSALGPLANLLTASFIAKQTPIQTMWDLLVGQAG
jgi:hypothetical protein